MMIQRLVKLLNCGGRDEKFESIVNMIVEWNVDVVECS